MSRPVESRDNPRPPYVFSRKVERVPSFPSFSTRLAFGSVNRTLPSGKPMGSSAPASPFLINTIGVPGFTIPGIFLATVWLAGACAGTPRPTATSNHVIHWPFKRILSVILVFRKHSILACSPCRFQAKVPAGPHRHRCQSAIGLQQLRLLAGLHRRDAA